MQVLQDIVVDIPALIGDQHVMAPTLRHDHGVSLLRAGRLPEAIRALSAAHTQAIAVLGSAHLETLRIGYGLGIALLQSGAWREAEERLQTLSEIQIARYGEAHPSTPVYLTGWGDAACRSGRHQEGLSVLRRAFALSAQRNPDRQPTFSIGSNLIVCALNGGQAGESSRVLDQLLEPAKVRLGARHPLVLTFQGQRAQVAARAGEHDAAFLLQQQTAGATLEVLGAQHPDTLLAYNTLGQMAVAAGRPADAVHAFDTIDSELQRFRSLMGSLAVAGQRHVLETFDAGQRSRAEALLELGRPQEAWQVLEHARARRLLEQVGQQRALRAGSLPDAERAAVDQLALRASLYATQAATAASAQARQAAAAEGRNLRQLQLAQWDRLSAQYPAFARMQSLEQGAVPDVTTALGPDDRLLSIMTTREGKLWATLLRPGTAPQWTRLGKSPALGETIKTWRTALLAQNQRFAENAAGQRLYLHRQAGAHPDAAAWRVAEQPPDDPSAWGRDHTPTEAADAIARELGRLLLDPLAGEIPTRGRLLLMVDGALSDLPWPLLPLRGSALVTQHAVSLVPSLSLLKQLTAGPAQITDRKAMLALGDVQFAADARPPPQPTGSTLAPAPSGTLPAGEVLRLHKWTPLPASRAEAQFAARLFSDAGATLALGPAASEDQLRRLSSSGDLRKHRYILLSTHGIFDPDNPSMGAVLLTPTGPAPEQDGRMTTAEFSALDMDSDLTILSACESARGDNAIGAGQMGMAQAMMVAGSRQTLTTLWPIVDDAAADFSRRFLTHLHQGHSAASALALTQRGFLQHPRRAWRQPRYWAGYVLQGYMKEP